MKSSTHQSTLHLSFKIKCCVDRLRPPLMNGHTQSRSAGLKGANRRLIHRSKRYCCRPDRSGPELAAARQKANNTKMRGGRQITDGPHIKQEPDACQVV